MTATLNTVMHDVGFYSVDPHDPSREHKWFDVGMLDYDEATQLYLVQKVNKNGRILDSNGHPVVNGGLLNDGMLK